MLTTKYKYHSLTLLIIFTFLIFSPSLFCDITNWDDDLLILKNPLIKSLSFSDLKTMFSSFYFFNYQPLTLFSFAIEYHYFQINPFIFHLDNLLLHLLNVFLVFKFIQLISNKANVSLIAATLFAIHPMRVESVTWITERKDVLYTFFFLLSLIYYSRYLIKANNWKPYVLALLFFIFSALAKGMAVSLSLVLLLLDFHFNRKITLRSLLDKIPFFALSLFFGLLAHFATLTKGVEALTDSVYTFMERLQLAGYALWVYFYKLILPIHLSTFYPYPKYQSGDLPCFFWLFPLLSIAMACLVIYSLKYSRKLVFGFGFFLATIVFVLQLMPAGNVLVADRYSYIPYLGLFYLTGETFNYFFNKSRYINLLKGLSVFILLLLSLLTFNRIDVWKNSISLWNNVLEQYPLEYKPYVSRANAEKEKHDLKAAMMDYDHSITLNPHYFISYLNRGNAKVELKDYTGALTDYSRCMELKPDNAQAYLASGVLNLNLQDFKGALSHLNKAVSLDSINPAAFYYRSKAEVNLENKEEALRDLNRALQLDPGNADASFERGKLNVVFHDYLTALKDFKLFDKANPNNPEVYFQMGNSYWGLMDPAHACENWSKAQQLGSTQAIQMIENNCKEKKQETKELSTPTIIGRYKNGQVKLQVMEILDQGKAVKMLMNFDEQGHLTEEGVVENLKYNGAINWFDEAGKIKISGFYKDTIPYGNWKEYYPDGTLQSEYSYVNGKKNGSLKYFHSNGKLWTERIYKDGKPWEAVSNFDAAGKPKEKGSLKNGNGTIKMYDEQGTFMAEITYLNGVEKP